MNDSFSIRRATPDDLPEMMRIYALARRFMAEHGNPHQWGDLSWPPQTLIEQDIRREKSYICEKDGQTAAVFFYDFGPDIEPTYRVIWDGRWLADGPYGVVHRIASAGKFPGAGKACVAWALKQSGHLRIDTHGDNYVMQNMLKGLGFQAVGTIYVEKDDDPRIAYELIV